MKKILFTGGGTAGHVTPNIALIDALRHNNYEISYVGSYDGIEKGLIEELGIPYYGIATGKFRRYKDLKNISDPFRVVQGCFEATRIIKQLKPDLVFSKGGYVSVPVILGAKLCKVPSILHESDMTPGLANKLCIPFASKICTTFSDTLKHLPKKKAVLTGTPIREGILNGNKDKGLTICGFNGKRPVVMMIGGSMGAARINDVLRKTLPSLLRKYQLVHICGKGQLKPYLDGLDGYKQFEYVKDELPHLFAMADVVVSRAGANAISELLALKKPNVLIPIPLTASRGDQLANAASFKTHGFSYVLEEEKMNEANLLSAINEVYLHREELIAHMGHSKSQDGTANVIREMMKILG